MSQLILYTLITVTTVVFALTRLLTSSALSRLDRCRNEPHIIPYWIPFVGHALNVLQDPSAVFACGRKISAKGSFALYILGKTYTIITNPELAAEELKQLDDTTSLTWVSPRSYMMGGMSAASTRRLTIAFADAPQRLDKISNTSEGAALTMSVLKWVENNLANFVSGNVSSVDQMPWEKLSNATVRHLSTSTSSEATECDLFALIHAFVTYAALQASVPTVNPDRLLAMTTAMLKLHENAIPLQWGIPRWLGYLLPLPQLHAAHISRNEVVAMFRSLHQDLDRAEAGEDGGEFTSSTDSSFVHKSFFTRRSAMKACGVSAFDLAQLDAGCFFERTRDAGPLIFWMLLSVESSSEKTKTSAVEEARRLVQVEEQPPLIPGSNIKEPPKIQVNTTGLRANANAPTLTRVFREAIRQHCKRISFRCVHQAEEVKLSDSSALVVSDNSYIAIAHELLYADPAKMDITDNAAKEGSGAMHEDQEHASSEEDLSNFMSYEQATIRWSTLKPLCIAVLAGILTMWDITPASSSRSWDGRFSSQAPWEDDEKPATRRTSSIDAPETDLRVFIHRRLAGTS
ncbi:MAG: hypothetical protein Q9162_005859 [Coniocarpon cinnabarinum]